LLALEIVLGIDNVIFISNLVNRLSEARQALARRLGLGMALVMRILLLLSLSWVIGLSTPLFVVLGQVISGRDLILILGGLFLLGKSTYEIHENLEGEEGHSSAKVGASFGSVLIQIVILDVVFSLDSVMTAVGMVDEVPVMIAAVTVAIVVMLVSAETVSGFVNRHPTVKMLALSFLLLIGFTLLLEGFGQHVPKGYIYFAMGFSVFVEFLNLRIWRRRDARSIPSNCTSATLKKIARTPSPRTRGPSDDPYALSTLPVRGRPVRNRGTPVSFGERNIVHPRHPQPLTGPLEGERFACHTGAGAVHPPAAPTVSTIRPPPDDTPCKVCSQRVSLPPPSGSADGFRALSSWRCGRWHDRRYPWSAWRGTESRPTPLPARPLLRAVRLSPWRQRRTVRWYRRS
jgi:predicted tellurium resistance membrane protein TerC